MSKKSSFRQPIDEQHGKRAQALSNSALHHLYQIHRSLPSQFSWRNSVLLTCQILGLLLNTFAADEKYTVLNRDNLTIPNQMQSSHKREFFFSIFCCIFEI